MNDLICHIAPLGMKTDWIKLGLVYYDWNYLIVLTTPQEEYTRLAHELRSDLLPGFKISDDSKLDDKLKKQIEIITIENRDILTIVQTIKAKTRELRKGGYKIYFNATSGLELWKFSAYFIAGTDRLIDKFYYFPKDSEANEKLKPLEIYLPIPLSKPLKKLLIIISEQKLTQKEIIEHTKYSKGMVSRYLKNLRELELIEMSTKDKKRFELTDKGMWYL